MNWLFAVLHIFSEIVPSHKDNRSLEDILTGQRLFCKFINFAEYVLKNVPGKATPTLIVEI